MRTRGHVWRWMGWFGSTGLVLMLGCAGAPPTDFDRLTRAEEVVWSGSEREAAEGSPVRGEEGLQRRSLLRRGDIEFGQWRLASGGLAPYRSHAAPEVFLIVAGEAEWTVDGQTRRVGPGTTIHHAPYADHRWLAVSNEPLRGVWARWAPGGDPASLIADRAREKGGSVTAPFFEQEQPSRSILPIDLARPIEPPPAGSVLERNAAARLAARRQQPRRPIVRSFVDSFEIPWSRRASGVRSRRTFSTRDFDWGQLRVEGPGRRRVFRSDSPALLHVVAGQVDVEFAQGERAAFTPGTTIAVEPGEEVVFRFDPTEPAAPDAARPRVDVLWLRWAAGGNAEVLSSPEYRFEPLPE